MSFLDSYFKYVEGAFLEHKSLFIFTVLFAVFCWIGGYLIADLVFSPAELADFEYLAQQTFYSFHDLMMIIINNCYINLESYIEAIFLCYGPFYDMMLNIGDSGVTTRATELACGDPFLFIKLTCLHGYYEDLSTILNSFAGFLLFSFVVRFIKNIFAPSKHMVNGTISNSFKINKKILFQSLAIFVLVFGIMVFAGFLEEYVSVAFGNFIVSLF